MKQTAVIVPVKKQRTPEENFYKLANWVIEHNTEELEPLKKQLQADFVYYISWHAESIFKKEIKIRDLKNLLAYISKNMLVREEIANLLRTNVRRIEKNLLERSLSSSTNQVSNLCDMWERDCEQELRSVYSSLIEALEDK